uniref:Uncharacterized protein n=1 Tax=Amphimedon queenslandica TaxID=400682 RepID=A0A1X7VQS3_AMPQE
MVSDQYHRFLYQVPGQHIDIFHHWNELEGLSLFSHCILHLLSACHYQLVCCPQSMVLQPFYLQ